MNINLDWRWSVHCTVWLMMILAIPMVQQLQINPKSVQLIEYIQTFFLLCCFLFTLISTLCTGLKGSQRAFWLWASLWWLTLLGRDQNWGRQTVHGYSPILYHSIAGGLILSLILMLSWRKLREGISYYYHQPFPIWDFLLAGLSFLLADAVERGRWVAKFLLYNSAYDDLLEELYECPFMLALFFVSFYMQWRTIMRIKKEANGLK